MIETINSLIQELADANDVSDGYHTFGELYQHRLALYLKLCEYEHACGRKEVWRSFLHDDKSFYEGWFILGIGSKIGEQITYHLPLSEWENCEFAKTLKKAPRFDSHTPEDVLKRIREL